MPDRVAGGSTSHIIQSLVANLVIASSKGVAAVFTGSGAMLAETIHSFADCGNQLLLLLGVKRARRAPDAMHPLGYGRSLYFWSFIVALMLFVGGGVFSIYEGIHKLLAPEPVEHVLLGVGTLLFALAIEGAATFSNVRELGRRRGATPFFRFIRETKDSDLVVVFGENSAASLGLVFALLALVLAHLTGDARWDAAGSLTVGLVLVGVAIFLAVEVKSLLVGEAADPQIAESVRATLAEHPQIKELLNVITVQQGPGEVMVALKVRVAGELTSVAVADTINAFERALKARSPEVRWCFVEPDTER
ncbi:MAG: cation diffusion facilitator family transporter [Deltaproteobacteria bacterium]|nr:cation diffusion facilitator family transporter [Deltaproteobacteria bacterium]